jgi:undecaprenyl-diphosphatase
MPWSWRHEYASLPSGHSTTAFAAAVAVAAVWPRARIPMLIYAAVIAASRVVITAHFISDVVAAAFVGAFGAVLVRNWFAARGLVFIPQADGSVRPKAGPSWRRMKSVAARLLGR